MIKFGKLSIEATALGSQGNALLGIRDSGKTYTATLLAEKLFESGIPFIAFDPIGVWRFLRVPGNGCGYPVVVSGGQAENGLPHPTTGSTVVLTVAHLDHTPENCDPSNLLHMCQRCHLRYDHWHHQQSRARAKHAAAKTGDLF